MDALLVARRELARKRKISDIEDEEVMLLMNMTMNSAMTFFLAQNQNMRQLATVISMQDQLNMIPRGIDLFDSVGRSEDIKQTLKFMREMDDEDFRRSYRLTREEFVMVLNKLDYGHQRYGGRPITPPAIQLGLTLRYLASGVYLDLSFIYCRFSKSSFYHMLHNTVDKICKTFDLRFPVGLEDNADGKKFRLPGCVGAVDGILIPIQLPPNAARSAYYCRKGFYALNMQAVVDANCTFTFVSLKWTGPTPDSTAFQATTLYHEAERSMIPNLTNGRYLAADSAYPLRRWIVKPFERSAIAVGSPREIFNFNLSSDRVTVERAFGMLVARWRALNITNSSKVSHVTMYAQACCRLHNICMKRIIAEGSYDDIPMGIPDGVAPPDGLPRPRYARPLVGADLGPADPTGANLRNALMGWCLLHGKERV